MTDDDEHSIQAGLPTNAETARSRGTQEDHFFKLPDYVQGFIDTAQKDVPEGWKVVPWTINRCVTIKNSHGKVHQVYSYEAIEDGIEFRLDHSL